MALLLSLVLRGGVFLSALLLLLGGAGELLRHGGLPASILLSSPPGDGSLPGLALEAFRGHPRALVYLGLLVLILTPVARVALATLLFLLEGDGGYGGVALWVFLLLVGSFLGLF